MKKKTVTITIVILMILAIALYFISGTYANYTSKATGNATATVAKWAVKVGGQEPAASQSFTLSFTEKNLNDDVVSGKIAPGSTLESGNIEIDLTDTEVAVDIKATIDEEALNETFGSANVSAKVKIDGGVESNSATTTVNLQEGSKFTADNGKKNVKVIIKWESNDTDDTSVGLTKGDQQVTLPVTITVSQHTAG